MEKIIPVPIDELNLDWKNPRLAEFGINAKTPPEEIFRVLWDNMALEEIVTSLVAHGFFDTEPLIVTREEGELVVIEGNRRLAAVMIVRDTSIVQNRLDENVLNRITEDTVKNLEKLPVIIVKDRQEAWRFVGFKHINGPAKWNSFAKAQHIAQVHKDYRIPLTEIAFQVGDTHNTVQKLFQGMMVIEQAEKEKVFSRGDIKKKRLYFSHLYTALQYEGFKEYLNIGDASIESLAPVPKDKKENLGQLLTWLYGSKNRSIEPIVATQNPDLKRLESVIRDREALASLKAGTPLAIAYELSRPKNSVFEESLFAAKRELQKAWSYVNEGYSGSDELLATAKSVMNLAKELHSRMNEIESKQKK